MVDDVPPCSKAIVNRLPGVLDETDPVEPEIMCGGISFIDPLIRCETVWWQHGFSNRIGEEPHVKMAIFSATCEYFGESNPVLQVEVSDWCYCTSEFFSDQIEDYFGVGLDEERTFSYEPMLFIKDLGEAESDVDCYDIDTDVPIVQRLIPGEYEYDVPEGWGSPFRDDYDSTPESIAVYVPEFTCHVTEVD